MELITHSPLDSEKLELVSRIIPLGLGKASAGVSHYSVLSILFLIQHSSESCTTGVCVQREWQGVVSLRKNLWI
ncbi:hypothetical protein DPMN_119229 [Dreissena polymorpha]|uniref:Uncharacterized protein n=1 Tax=Dreissena polymorpha TaxID=45954 RepID=A0A9D4GI98_DREPO|nr:hypothetical protein DPMN_119229 [Dreissena polymorpha]